MAGSGDLPSNVDVRSGGCAEKYRMAVPSRLGCRRIRRRCYSRVHHGIAARRIGLGRISTGGIGYAARFNRQVPFATAT